ncbi:Scaffold-type E3 ligase [Pleosporales sp. CAS-2024a]
MPPAYTAQQKNAIAQFTSFTSVDRTAAARVLKSHNWDTQAAMNSLKIVRRSSASSEDLDLETDVVVQEHTAL